MYYSNLKIYQNSMQTTIKVENDKKQRSQSFEACASFDCKVTGFTNIDLCGLGATEKEALSELNANIKKIINSLALVSEYLDSRIKNL